MSHSDTEIKTGRVVIKDYYPFKVGEVVEMGKYDFDKQKIVFDKNLTIKNIHKSSNLFEPDYLEFEEIPGLFLKHRFYKKGTLER